MHALDIANLTAGYQRRPIIRDVSLMLEPGDWFCLLGPNGAGKSTLLACIGGRLRPMSGTVSIAGHRLDREPTEARRRLGFGITPDQLPGLLTGRQCMAVHALAQRVSRIEDDVLSLATTLLSDQVLDTFIDTWSFGMRQKLSILLTLLGQPALIVLDEAFNGLDPRSVILLRQWLGERVAQKQCAVILATHTPDLVAGVATGAGWLEEGQFRKIWRGDDFQRLRPNGLHSIESELTSAPASPG